MIESAAGGRSVTAGQGYSRYNSVDIYAAVGKLAFLLYIVKQ